MAPTKKPRKTTTVCTSSPRFTTNKAGRIVSAAASKAAKANYKNNTALKRWQKSVREASKETGVTLTPQNLKKGGALYTAAKKRFDS